VSTYVASGFLSYARSDDEREGGRISRIAEHIANEFETLTGSRIDIFVDQAGIEWGEAVRSKLDEALLKTTFFIPILTPTYFTRDECRREMVKFVTSAKALGLEELLMSIRYVAVADLREDSADELKAIAAGMQFEDWTELRLSEEDSAAYRRAVNKLAQRLVELTHALEATPPDLGSSASTPNLDSGDSDDDAPGTFDLVAELQPRMTAWNEALSRLSPALQKFNEIFGAAGAEMNSYAGSTAFAQRLVRSRKLAEEIDPALEEYEDLTKEYTARLVELDPSVRAFMDLVELANAPLEWENGVNPFSSILNLARVSQESVEKTTQAADVARTYVNTSRDLRPVLRRFEAASRNVGDAQSIILGWAEEIQRRGLAPEGAA
jgi:hypothetical protein